jgi:hypothetical protein
MEKTTHKQKKKKDERVCGLSGGEECSEEVDF